MRLHEILCLCVAAGVTVAKAIDFSGFGPDAVAACGETAARVCFGVDGGTSQDIEIEDIEYAASALRSIGQSNDGSDALWSSMLPPYSRSHNHCTNPEMTYSCAVPSGVDCEEWQLPVSFGGTVMSLAKHINPRINSSVLYTDIADAIDGGEDATEEQKQASLLGCGKNGGMFGVVTDATNPAYNTQEYKDSKAQPSGILIKLVRAPI